MDAEKYREEIVTNLENAGKNDDRFKLELSDVLIEGDKLDQSKAWKIVNELSLRGVEAAKFRKKLWINDILRYTEITKPDNTINIMYVSSNEYIKYVIVSMKSVLVNHPNRRVKFFIINVQITKMNMHLLEEFIKAEKCDVELIRLDISIFNDIAFPRNGLWVKAILSRIVPQYILPSGIDKVLSLGVDVIVNGNLEKLYDSEMEDALLYSTLTGGMFKREFEEELDSDINIEMVNGDLLLFNLKKIREKYTNNLTSFLSQIRVIQNENTKMTTEESILPYIYHGAIKLVDCYKYNYRADSVVSLEAKNSLFPKNRIIVQMVGRNKPWNTYLEDDELSLDRLSIFITNFTHNSISKIWWKYAKLCINYDDLISEMKIQRTTIERAVQAGLKYNTSKAIEMLASNRDADIEGILGRMYRDGKGVEKDIGKSAGWFIKMAEKYPSWVAEATDVLLRTDNPDNWNFAFRKCSGAVDQYPAIAGRLGRMYRDGKGVEKDIGKSAEWFIKMAEKYPSWKPEFDT